MALPCDKSAPSVTSAFHPLLLNRQQRSSTVAIDNLTIRLDMLYISCPGNPSLGRYQWVFSWYISSGGTINPKSCTSPYQPPPPLSLTPEPGPAVSIPTVPYLPSSGDPDRTSDYPRYSTVTPSAADINQIVATGVGVGEFQHKWQLM